MKRRFHEQVIYIRGRAISSGICFLCEVMINDGQIVGIVHAHNKAEVDARNLARSTSTNSEVKMYGYRLVGGHNGSNWLINDLEKREKISSQSSPASDSLKSDGQKSFEKLKGLKGAAFDVTYIDHEVEDHQKALDLFDKNLIPSAKIDELKSLLNVIRSCWLDGHLEHAKLIQKSLGKS